LDYQHGIPTPEDIHADQVEQDRLTRWHERNRLAGQQSQQGLSRPLNDETVLARLRKRFADEGILD